MTFSARCHALLLLLASQHVGVGLAAPPLGDGVKWHPGHYVLLYVGTNDKVFDQVVTEITSHPLLRGVQKRYTWASLEPEENRYDFSQIERDLSKLQRVNRRLVIQIDTKSFPAHKNTAFAPAYLRSPRFAGGVFRHGVPGRGLGENVKLWNDEVRDRFVSLVQALGARFNAEPYFEAINLDETVPGKPGESVPDYDEKRYISNLLQVDRALRAAFPNTVVIQYTNFPKWALPEIARVMVETGVGLGGPDVLVGDENLRTGVYEYYPKLAGIVPLGLAVQAENYVARRYHGTEGGPQVEELYAFARDNLKANYIFWLRHVLKDGTRYLPRVIEMLSRPGWPRDLAGGLSSRCPSKLERCVE